MSHNTIVPVKQEVVIAIVGGFLIGAAAAFAVVQLSSRMKSPPDEVEIVTATPPPSSPTSEPTKSVGSNPLEIVEPSADTIAEKKSTTVSGKTTPGNVVVIESESDSIAQPAASDGTFTATVALQEGANRLSVTSYDERGAGVTQVVSVFYTSEAL